MANKYIPIVNTDDLEDMLAQSLAQMDELSDEIIESDKPKAQKKKKGIKKIIHNICLVLLGLIVIAIIGVTIINAQRQAELKEVSKLQDGRLISYEAKIYDVKKLALLFAVYDDASYQRAKTAVNLSDELYSNFFVNEHYNKTAEPIKIEYQDILYEITENDYVSYMLYFKSIQGTTIHEYTLQAEFYGDTCVYLEVLN